MDSAAAELAKITVPDEDGAINQALNDLDARIASWSSAMQEAHRALAQMLEHTRTQAVAAPEDKPPPQTASTPTAKTTESKPEGKDSKQSSLTQTRQGDPARPVAIDPPKVTREMLGHAPGSKATPAKPTAEEAKTKGGKQPKGLAAKLKRMVGAQEEGADASAAKVDDAARTGQKSENEKANESLTYQSQGDDDEALLATLDPKVAKVIRIKRRLSNGKKSVRELLNEM